MAQNPFKIYEYDVVVPPSGLQPWHEALDLGCGRGRFTLALARQCHRVVGVDVSDNALAVARKFLRFSPLKSKVEFVGGTLEAAGFPDASFDRIYSFCVLEHIPNLSIVLAELLRLLKPDGEFHASVDSLATIKSTALLNQHRIKNKVYQYFTEASLRRQITAAGLEVLELYSIMKGEFARREFEKRINASYKLSLMRRFAHCRRFRDEDQQANSQAGIMIVVRCRKPSNRAARVVAHPFILEPEKLASSLATPPGVVQEAL